MEHDPFAVVEAMAIEAFAVGADKAYLYIRGEYPLAEARIDERDRRDAADAGLLGDLDIELRRGAGAYICGEETALFESIEGKRGEPRNKPPFPVEVGLFGKPTAVNNVETLVNVLLIVGSEGGVDEFRAIGTEGSIGPKLFCVSGHVARPGVYEVEFGVTLRELLDLAGGVPAGKRPQGRPPRRRGRRLRRPGRARHPAHVRGDAGDRGDARLRRRHGVRRDRPTWSAPSAGSPSSSATSRAASASRAGSGRSARRSCSRGWPRPPRAATGRRSSPSSREIGQAMRDASICGLGQTASSAIESAMRQPELVAL